MNRGTSREHIEDVVAIPDRVLRNYWVSQTYFDLSNGVRALIEPDTCNWCTFAVWASSTVGENIRGEALPHWLHDRVLLPDGIMGAVATTKAHPRWPSVAGFLHDLTPELLLEVTRELLGEMAVNLSDGNTEVFAEIAPPAAQLLQVYSGNQVDVHEARASVLEVCDGAALYEGVNHLRAGYSLWCDALAASDPIQRSQFILGGSLHLAVHEQSHLQPVIESSMDMGVNLAASRLKNKLLRDEHDARAVNVVLDSVLRPATRGIGELWDSVMTATLGTLTSPEGTMRLDHDVPKSGEPSFIPSDFTPLVVEDLKNLWRLFNHAKENGRGSFATDWASFKDRMNFISNLFISRHHEPLLFEVPFNAATLADLSAGRTPSSGRLSK